MATITDKLRDSFSKIGNNLSYRFKNIGSNFQDLPKTFSRQNIQAMSSNLQAPGRQLVGNRVNQFLGTPLPQNISQPATQFFNAVEQNPISQFSAGLIQGQNLGLGRSPIQPPMGTVNKVAFGLGSLGGSFNPYSATGKTVGAITKATNPIISRVIKPVAGPVSSRIAAGVANVAQGGAINPVFGQKPFTPGSVAVDFATGAAFGPNQFKGNTGADVKKLTDEVLTGKRTLTAPLDLLVSHEGAPDKARVNYWANKIFKGEKVEPIKIIREGSKYGIEDGKHRFEAYQQLGVKDIPVELVGGKKAVTTYIKDNLGRFAGSNPVGMGLVGNSAQPTKGDIKIPVRGKPNISGGESANENLKIYLDEINSPQMRERLGKEKIISKIGNITKTIGDFGSGRYLYKDESGRIVGAINYTTDPSRGSVISNIYTARPMRNRGIATTLLNQAKKDFPDIKVDSHLTEAGAKFFHISQPTNQSGFIDLNAKVQWPWTKEKQPSAPSVKQNRSFDKNIPQSVDKIIEEGRKQIGEVKPTPSKSVKQSLTDFYTQWVDRYNPLVKASQKAKTSLKSKGAQLRPEYDPEYLVRRLTGAGGIADSRFNTKLKPVLEQVDQLKIPKQDLDVYLANKRIAGFGQAGRDIYGADPKKAQQIVSALETKYGNNIKGIADQLYSYQNKGFQEMVDAGFISPEDASKIKSQNPDYSPLYRVMDEVSDYLGIPTRKAMQGSQPIQKIKGSTRKIESPLESIIGNTFTQRAAIEKNRVAKSIVGLQNITDMGFSKAAKSSDSTITVWSNGKKEFWNVGKDIADVAKGANEESMNLVLKILQQPASLLRQGATGRNPEFMVPNVIRDQLDAAVTSKYGYIPFIDYISGFKSMLANDEVYQKWANSGAKIDLGELSGKKSISKLFSEKTAKKGLFNWISSGLDVMGKLSEQPTRVGLFKKAYNKTGNELIAAMESRDATVDFARMGSKMKVANSIIPFLNVGVQGFDKLIRSVKNNPGKVLFNAAMYGAAPAAAVTAYNLHNHPQEYSEIPQYEKDSNFVLVKGRNSDGTVDYLTIPKGNIIPTISNPIQSFMEFAAGQDNQSFKQMALNVLSGTVPVLGQGSSVKEIATKTIGSNLPQAIKPITENLVNKSFYKYDPNKEQTKEIVPSYLHKKPPYQQAYDFTPEMYKSIGAFLNVSPLQVKNLMEGYLAGYTKIPANIIQSLYNMSRGENVSQNDIPLVRRFLKQTYPSNANKPKAEVKSPGVMERLTGKVGATESTLPSDTESLKVLYNDASNVIKGYTKNKVRAQYGSTTKTLEEYQQEADKAIALKKKIEKEYPEQVFQIELDTYGKDSGSTVKERTSWIVSQLKKSKNPNDLVKKLYEGQVLTQSVVEELNSKYNLGLTKYNYGDKLKSLKTGKKSISDSQILSAYKKALAAVYAPVKYKNYAAGIQQIKPIKLKTIKVNKL